MYMGQWPLMRIYLAPTYYLFKITNMQTLPMFLEKVCRSNSASNTKISDSEKLLCEICCMTAYLNVVSNWFHGWFDAANEVGMDF